MTRIVSDGVYEKTACHVKERKNRLDTHTFCQEHGMKLFDPSSSSSASTQLRNFVKNVLNGNRKNFVHAVGRQATSWDEKCRMVNGAGEFMNLWCSLEYTFVCEYQGKYLN
jgi:hypothetical protein